FYSLIFFFSSRRRHTRWPRDWSQTCALPIYSALVRRVERHIAGDLRTGAHQTHLAREDVEELRQLVQLGSPQPSAEARCTRIFRSEERRVGKECRSRWAQYH